MLIDTSGFFALFDRTDVFHDAARAHWTTARRRITHSYVLAEFIPLAQTRRLERARAVQFLESIQKNPSLKIRYVDKKLHLAAFDLLRQRPDKDWSLCDAVSFILMAARGVSEALTTDHHFEQAGFVRLLRP
jgi:predicted nucleic acid-binding protein